MSMPKYLSPQPSISPSPRALSTCVAERSGAERCSIPDARATWLLAKLTLMPGRSISGLESSAAEHIRLHDLLRKSGHGLTASRRCRAHGIDGDHPSLAAS